MIILCGAVVAGVAGCGRCCSPGDIGVVYSDAGFVPYSPPLLR